MDVMDKSSEPMDIDQSINSDKSFDYSTSRTVWPLINIKQEPMDKDEITVKPACEIETKEWHVKKFHINLMNKKRKSLLPYHSVALSIILLFVAVIIYFFIHIECLESIEVDKINYSLTKKLYGQDDAIEKIIKTLKTDAKHKILFFYGSTGVGKTFAGSLLLNFIYGYSNIYHFTMPSFREKFSTNLMLGLIMCKSAVFMVDGLNSDDMDISKHIKEVIEKSENLNKNITIILIYNCDTVSPGFQRQCDSQFANKLEDDFKDLKVYQEFVKFEILREEHLLKCIEAEIGEKIISQTNMKNILKSFNVTTDGCKSVHTKMKILNVL